MGKVVQFDGPDGSRAAPGEDRRRGRGDKTALVLGGGGFTGGVYEMGALRAFDLLAVNRTVNEFDIYVGTSAGSFVGEHGRERGHARGDVPGARQGAALADREPDPPNALRPNYRGFAGRLALLPLRIAGTLRHLAGNLGEISMVDVVTGLAEGLPTGIYHNRGIERYVPQRALRSRPDQRLP